MRERRIRSTAIPELRVALEAGLVTTYRAGEIAKLPADQQTAVLAQWTNRSLCRTRGQEIAAQVIRKALRRRSRVDLGEIASAIRAAIELGQSVKIVVEDHLERKLHVGLVLGSDAIHFNTPGIGKRRS